MTRLLKIIILSTLLSTFLQGIPLVFMWIGTVVLEPDLQDAASFFVLSVGPQGLLATFWFLVVALGYIKISDRWVNRLTDRWVR